MRASHAAKVCLLAASLLSTSIAIAEVTIELVPVGNPGNEADFRHSEMGFGAVSYPYMIAKYEVTKGQYRQFLNAKAALSDPHGLFNPQMPGPHGGIDRRGSGTAGDPWVYSPFDNNPFYDNLPVNYVSLWDAARFANWLHNGQGNGDTETGAYTGLDNDNAFARQPGARFFLPTENEWYKAAYYDPNADGEIIYWEFPTRSNNAPSTDDPPGTDTTNGSANIATGVLTPVGAFNAKPSTSAYGTFDQAGNLWEWNETFFGYFGLRGGSFDNVYGAEASHRDSYPAYFENRIMGFRLAALPEPGHLLAGAIGMAFLSRRRSRLA